MNKISKFIVASSILLGSAGVYANTSDAAELSQSEYQRLASFYEYQEQTDQSSTLTQSEYQRLASMQ
ncbi:hypothetical protein [Macrococcoides canis]|uniref:hypothetical protein n=1 Tax=Macrococcoides canis TaxID=1855823 RepID=UPI001F350F33|nr:hypothetical protein [Macrococcus canis]UJS27900.1 hypothetical protein L2Z53_00665 [Macrococcus canis]UTH00176.1 hypothetical protein KFV04_00410 [Macrococcus canis]UTH11649.1 hypothetical protein KFV10_00600 [Macrococcus canis]WBF52820.1 hypothetical protein LL975_00240 [Macrococcus canis]